MYKQFVDPLTIGGEQISGKGVKDSPMTVALEVTKRCNFRCIHCYNDSGIQPQSELSDDEILNIADQVAKLRPITVCLCGGEPTLRKNLLEIIAHLSYNAGYVTMVSNGYLIQRDIAKAMKSAGLHLVQISLDGDTETQHDTLRGRPGAFKSAINAIDVLLEVGIQVVTSFTPSKLNYRTVGRYIDYCKGLGVREVRSMPLIPMGRGKSIDKLLLTSEEYAFLQRAIYEKKEAYKFSNFTIEWGDPIDHYHRLPNLAQKGHKTHLVDIRSNGDLGISTYLPIYFGNLMEHTLKDYWDNGYCDAWKNQDLLNIVSKIETIYDLNDASNMTPKYIRLL